METIKKVFFAIAAIVITGYGIFLSLKDEIEMNDIMLANIEALANNETGTTHSLRCGGAGIKMCEATCGRCNVTLKAWGNGESVTFSCSAH